MCLPAVGQCLCPAGGRHVRRTGDTHECNTAVAAADIEGKLEVWCPLQLLLSCVSIGLLRGSLDVGGAVVQRTGLRLKKYARHLGCMSGLSGLMLMLCACAVVDGLVHGPQDSGFFAASLLALSHCLLFIKGFTGCPCS